MQARRLWLDHKQLKSLINILHDTECWQQCTVLKQSIPDGVAALQACVPVNVNVRDFAWVDQSAAIARKSLSSIFILTLTRKQLTKLLYSVFANLESDMVGELFAELEKDYDRYRSDKLFGNHSSKSYQKLQAMRNRYDTTSSILVSDPIIPSLYDQHYHLYNELCQLKADHGMLAEMKVDVRYLVAQMDLDVRTEWVEEFRRVCKQQFIKEYPTLMEAYHRYIEDTYIKSEEVFIRDCKCKGAINFLQYVCDPSCSGLKIKATSQDQCSDYVAIDSQEDVDRRMECILNAIFSKQYFQKIFVETGRMVGFVITLARELPVDSKLISYRQAIIKKMQAILSEWDIFNYYFKLNERTIAYIEVLEKNMPNLMRDARVSEKKKNWQVLGLAHLRKNSIFHTVPKDILKIIVNHTATQYR